MPEMVNGRFTYWQFTCLYADNTRVDFDIHHEGHFFDIDSQPLVDIHHQPDLVEKKGAWEVVHDKLYIVGQEGNLITIQADMLIQGREKIHSSDDCLLWIEHLYPDGSFFDDGMKRYREERGWKYPKSWKLSFHTFPEEVYKVINIKWGLPVPGFWDEFYGIPTQSTANLPSYADDVPISVGNDDVKYFLADKYGFYCDDFDFEDPPPRDLV